jgi:hypothetical protein
MIERVWPAPDSGRLGGLLSANHLGGALVCSQAHKMASAGGTHSELPTIELEIS